MACVLGAAIVAAFGMQSTSHADPPGNVWVTRPGGLNCPSATSFGFVDIECAAGKPLAGFKEVLIEVPGSTPVYVCGENAANDGGVNRGNYTTSCSARCSDATACPRGATFNVNVVQDGTGKCISGAAADAGVITVVHCLR